MRVNNSFSTIRPNKIIDDGVLLQGKRSFSTTRPNRFIDDGGGSLMMVASSVPETLTQTRAAIQHSEVVSTGIVIGLLALQYAMYCLSQLPNMLTPEAFITSPELYTDLVHTMYHANINIDSLLGGWSESTRNALSEIQTLVRSGTATPEDLEVTEIFLSRVAFNRENLHRYHRTLYAARVRLGLFYPNPNASGVNFPRPLQFTTAHAEFLMNRVYHYYNHTRIEGAVRSLIHSIRFILGL